MSDTPDPVAVIAMGLRNLIMEQAPDLAFSSMSIDCTELTEYVLSRLFKSATLTTVEKLDALPVGCVVQDVERAWTRRARSWYCTDGPIAGKAPKLPAILLYHPAARHR